MGNVNNGGAGIAQPADDVEEFLSFISGQGGRRLIHDDQLSVSSDRSQDLDLLLIGRPHLGDGHIGRQTKAGPGSQSLIALPHVIALQNTHSMRLHAEKDVLKHAEFRHERELLRDHRDAVRQRVTRRGVVHLSPMDDHLALIGANDAADDLAERRLAGAILTDQGVDHASLDIKIDVGKRFNCVEALANVA